MSGQIFYLWLDLETEGLEDHDDILEVAWRLSGTNLSVTESGEDLIDGTYVSCAPEVAAMHAKSGLLEAYAEGPRVPLREAESGILEAIREHAKDGVIQLAGSGVHFDRRFLEVYMPHLYAALHYRLMDVSVVERFLTDICGLELDLQPEQKAHRAADDIDEHLDRAIRMRDLIQEAFRGVIYVRDEPEVVDDD